MKKILITGASGFIGAPHQFAPLPPGRPRPSPHAGPPGPRAAHGPAPSPSLRLYRPCRRGHEVSGPRRLLPCQPRRHAPPLPGRPGAVDARGAHRLPVEPQRLWRHPRDPALHAYHRGRPAAPTPAMAGANWRPSRRRWRADCPSSSSVPRASMVPGSTTTS